MPGIRGAVQISCRDCHVFRCDPTARAELLSRCRRRNNISLLAAAAAWPGFPPGRGRNCCSTLGPVLRMAGGLRRLLCGAAAESESYVQVGERGGAGEEGRVAGGSLEERRSSLPASLARHTRLLSRQISSSERCLRDQHEGRVNNPA